MTLPQFARTTLTLVSAFLGVAHVLEENIADSENESVGVILPRASQFRALSLNASVTAHITKRIGLSVTYGYSYEGIHPADAPPSRRPRGLETNALHSFALRPPLGAVNR